MPDQLMLRFTAEVVHTRGPGGTVIVHPGKVVVQEPELTVAEATKLTRESRSTILSLIADGTLTARRTRPKPGSKWRITRQSLDAHIARGTNQV